jgi:hypothetical protein
MPSLADPVRRDNGMQKPVQCMRRPIRHHTRPGDAVYDPFLGSGTTIIAAEQVGRRCLGMELDAIYVDVAIRRWQEFTGNRLLLSDGGHSCGMTSLRIDAAKSTLVFGVATRR